MFATGQLRIPYSLNHAAISLSIAPEASRFYVLSLDTFEAEKHVIERAIKVIFAVSSARSGAAFIGHPREEGVATDTLLIAELTLDSQKQRAQ